MILLLQIVSALCAGAVGGSVAILVSRGAPWPLIFVGTLVAGVSWAWTARQASAGLLFASVAWNIAHDFGEYGTVALAARPSTAQLFGITLVVVGTTIVAAGRS